MAGFGGFGQQQIGQNTGQRPVRRFGGGQPAPGAMPGYGRTGGAPPAGGGFPGQGGGVAGGFPGQGGSPRVAPINLPPQGPPNPMPAFRNVDATTAGPGMTPPVAPAAPVAPPVQPVQPGVAANGNVGVAPVGTGGPGAVPSDNGFVSSAAPSAAPRVSQVPRLGMMNQPLNYAAGLGGFQR
jgi:hypothetical protein